VVLAAQEIGIKVGLSTEELNLLAITAWFHDTGYTRGYVGHEHKLSQMILLRFLIRIFDYI